MTCLVKKLGIVEYEPIWRAMQAFTAARTAKTRDEIWFLEHLPVYTLGMAAKEEHLLRPTTIPVLKTDRGGQITYHGPGQLVAYLMLDFKRMEIGIRALITRVEQSLIDLLSDYGILAYGNAQAPGVYVEGKKLASLGLRIRNGAIYHGVSLNVNMDLTPFNWINPCGHAQLRMTQLKSLGVNVTVEEVSYALLPHLTRLLEYVNREIE